MTMVAILSQSLVMNGIDSIATPPAHTQVLPSRPRAARVDTPRNTSRCAAKAAVTDTSGLTAQGIVVIQAAWHPLKPSPFTRYGVNQASSRDCHQNAPNPTAKQESVVGLRIRRR